MPSQLSYLNQHLILNGERITGFADEEPAVDLPNIALSKTKRGPDGTMFVMGTGAKGGEVTVKLLPTSPSVKTFMRAHAEIQQGARIDFEGSFSDDELGFSMLLRGGVLVEAPPGITPDMNPHFKFDFEEAVPEFDGAQFAPTPGSA